MKSASTTTAAMALAAVVSVANAGPAFKFPIERRVTSGARISANTGSLPTFSVGGDSSNGGITNVNDISYTTPITVCGQKTTALLDTGSTDLWIKPASALSGVETTPLSTKIVYGSGDIAGPICLCPVTLGSYSIPKQAFIEATTANVDNLFVQNIYGIVGLGFDSLSKVNKAVISSDSSATWGRSLLTNLFYANPKTPNYVAFLLDRASDLDETASGSFTVGETESAYASIIKQPALPVFPDADASRWNVVLDAITVNGTAVPLKSSVYGAPSGKTIALLDTGTSLIYGPKAAGDAIYRAIPGSSYYKSGGFWLLDCLSTAEVILKFGGVDYHVHPLDMSMITQVTMGDGTAGSACAATFRENTIGAGSGELDWLMGDSFLRNVYSMFDFGDLDTSTGGLVGHPFVKLLPLPTSEYKAATAEFQTARSVALSKLPPSVEPIVLTGYVIDDNSASDPPSTKNLASSDGSNGSNAATVATLAEDMSKMVQFLPIILGLLGANVLIILVLVIVGCVAFFKRKGRSSYQPVKTQGH